MPREDIRGLSDEEKVKRYEEVDRLFHQGKKVAVRQHKSGFPAITIDCESIRLLTDCLSLEDWWHKHNKG